MIERQDYDGFFLCESEDGLGKCMVPTGDWRSEFADLASSLGVSALRLSSSVGWNESSIEFVRGLTFLEGVEIYRWSLKNVEPLESLAGLRAIGLEVESSHPLSFDAFHALCALKITWRPGFDSSLKCANLRHLNVEKLPHLDLRELELPLLERLQMSSCGIESLEGIQSANSLKTLDLYQCRSLNSLDGLRGAKGLEVFAIDGCKRLDSLSTLVGCPRLKRIVVENCGSIASLEFLEALDEVTHVYLSGDTRLEDGDLSFALRMKGLMEFRFQNKKHYSHSYKSMRELLATGSR